MYGSSSVARMTGCKGDRKQQKNEERQACRTMGIGVGGNNLLLSLFTRQLVSLASDPALLVSCYLHKPSIIIQYPRIRYDYLNLESCSCFCWNRINLKTRSILLLIPTFPPRQHAKIESLRNGRKDRLIRLQTTIKHAYRHRRP